MPVTVVELAAAIEFSTSREKYVFVSPSPAASWLRARGVLGPTGHERPTGQRRHRQPDQGDDDQHLEQRCPCLLPPVTAGPTTPCRRHVWVIWNAGE